MRRLAGLGVYQTTLYLIDFVAALEMDSSVSSGVDVIADIFVYYRKV